MNTNYTEVILECRLEFSNEFGKLPSSHPHRMYVQYFMWSSWIFSNRFVITVLEL